MSEARANRKSPVRIAIELSHRALALCAPRRRSASSITSSWYSVARCVSSTTSAAGTTPVDVGSPNSDGEHHEQRPEPLAAGVDQVPGGLVDEVDVGRDRQRELLLDLEQLGAHPRLELGVDVTRSE